MTTKLVGRDDVAASGFSAEANRVFLTKYTAVATGTLTEIHVRVKANAAGNIILGIYADDGTGNNPTGNPLATTASTAVTSGSERSVTVALTSSLSVTTGTVYWLACNNDCGNIFGYKTEASRYFYKNLTYGALPSPYGTGWTGPTTTEEIIIAGWGNALQTVTPSGIATALAIGSPTVTHGSPQTIAPSGRATSLAFGLPTISHGGGFIIPPGIASHFAAGVPILGYRQFLGAGGIALSLHFGSLWIGSGRINPAGIASGLRSGRLAVLRFPSHVILEASYLAESPEVNYTYVVGQDVTGATVAGNAITQAEVDLVGSRLEVQHEPAAHTAAAAGYIAANVLAKLRLDGRKGSITIPPHCGLELWDVINVVDEGANQSANYRVSGYVMEYDSRMVVYRHRLDLCAP
jgi:hypothetical protein